MRVLAALSVLLVVLPVAVAQTHDHGEAAPVVIATDLAPDGLALVGHPVHFAVIQFGDDADPDFHSDLPVRVWLDDTVLFETTAVTGHDYDGVQQFDIAFPQPGSWRVEALAGGDVVAHRNGTVVDAATDAAGTVVGDAILDADVTAAEGTITVDFDIQQGGERVDHVDGWVEIIRDGRLVFRTHTHTHEERQRLTYSPDVSGDHDVRITGYIAFPTAAGPRFTPVAQTTTVTVDAAPALPPAAVATAPPTAANAVIHGQAGDLQLIGTYDPWTSVGPDTIQHLSAMVLAEGAPVQHVDFEATLTGPAGTAFSSDTLHEYDGIYTVAAQRSIPGVYELTVTASRGDWSDTITMPYAVTKPAPPGPLGPQLVTLEGDAAAGTSSDLLFDVRGVDGRPFAHGEIELQLRQDGLPVLHSKLHTHGDGTFPFTYTPGQAGDLAMTATPFPLESQPVAGYHGAALGDPVPTTLPVRDGPGLPPPAPQEDLASEPADRESPAVPAALIVAGLAALIRATRRR